MILTPHFCLQFMNLLAKSFSQETQCPFLWLSIIMFYRIYVYLWLIVVVPSYFKSSLLNSVMSYS